MTDCGPKMFYANSQTRPLNFMYSMYARKHSINRSLQFTSMYSARSLCEGQPPLYNIHLDQATSGRTPYIILYLSITATIDRAVPIHVTPGGGIC